jgi:hypothetical protein
MARASRHLRSEHYDDAQGQPAHQGQDGREHGGRTALGREVERQRHERADQHDHPERHPARLQEPRADRAEAQEEDHEERQLQDREVAIDPGELRLGALLVAAQTCHEAERGRGHAQARRQEQGAERPGVAPDRLVAHAQQDAGIARQEESEDGADDHEHAAETAAEERSP